MTSYGLQKCCSTRRVCEKCCWAQGHRALGGRDDSLLADTGEQKAEIISPSSSSTHRWWWWLLYLIIIYCYFYYFGPVVPKFCSWSGPLSAHEISCDPPSAGAEAFPKVGVWGDRQTWSSWSHLALLSSLYFAAGKRAEHKAGFNVVFQCLLLAPALPWPHHFRCPQASFPQV